MQYQAVLRRSVWVAIALLAFGACGAARADVINFEDLVLAPNSHWNGPDPSGTDAPDPYGGPLPVKVGSFTSGGARFNNEYNPNWGNWSGFAYSNRGDTITAGFTNQFSSFAGGGAGSGNDNFAVAFGYVHNLNPQDPLQRARLPRIEFAQPVDLESVAVTNATYAALGMRDGDSFTKKFGGTSGADPDWFKLSVYATDGDGNLRDQVVELFLADYRFDDADQDYILDAWTTLDLSVFSGVQRLYFNLTSSDATSTDMNTPSTFVLDNLQFAQVPEPGSLLLAACGALLVLPLVRRRRA